MPLTAGDTLGPYEIHLIDWFKTNPAGQSAGITARRFQVTLSAAKVFVADRGRSGVYFCGGQNAALNGEGMPRQDLEGNERTIHVKAGKKIEFPVDAKHPLARFQTLTPVRSADDVQEFLMLWAQNAAARELPTPDPAALVARLKKAKLGVLRLFANDLRVERGAVVTLNSPLNRLEFDNVTIAGDLIVRGDLVLNCTSFAIE